jgi:hypothetical protein
MRHLFSSYLLVLTAALAMGCKRPRNIGWTKGGIEVAPDQFVEVDYLSMGKHHQGNASLKEIWKCGPDWELFELRAPAHGTNVIWRTCGWPIVLRLYENRFYGVAFDRCSLSKPDEPKICRLRYFAQDGSVLREISPAAFPRGVAVQNVMLDTYEFYCGSEKRTPLDLAVKADPNDICFSSTLTAAMWNELATGSTYEDFERVGASTNLLKAFARTNDVIRLRTIIKYPQQSSPVQQRPATQLDWLLNHL